MTFGEKIAIIRKHKNLSTTKLAKMAGMAQSTLRDIELGNTTATYKSIEKICKALDMSFQQIEDFDVDFNDEKFISDLTNTVSRFNSNQKKLLLEFLRSIN